MRSVVLSALVAAILCALPASAIAAPASVSIGEFFYKKDYVTVNPGDTVTWKNTGDVLHTVTSASGAPQRFDSDQLDVGATFARTFTKPGQYSYVCTLHPGLMDGVVQVGPDKTKPKATKVKTSKTSKKLKIGFRLSEKAKLVATFKRGRKTVKTVRTKVLDRGSGSLSYSSKKKLAPGSYTASVTATDQAGNKARLFSAKFKVR